MASRALTPARLDAFEDELEKQANPLRFLLNQLTSAAHGTATAAKTFDPRRTGQILRRGWEHLSPVEGATQRLMLEARRAGFDDWASYAKTKGLPEDIMQAVRGDPAAHKALQEGMKETRKAEGAYRWYAPEWAGGSGTRRAMGEQAKAVRPHAETSHLFDESQRLRDVATRPRELAEELSRRGWTGSGELTKYAPVGGKSMLAGFGGAFSPHIVKRDDPHAFGGGKPRGHAERALQHLGGHAGMVAGMPTGFGGSIAGWEVGSRSMGTLGKGIDKLLGYHKRRQQSLRPPPTPSGATTPSTTLFAPSAERRA